jgi:hypothetical protein
MTMKTRWLWILLLALALPLSAQEKAASTTPAAEASKATGITLGTPAAKTAKGDKKVTTTCALTISPSTANGGQTFSFSVAYTPCMSQPQTETFTFKWPSILTTFSEVTVRQKKWKTSGGCVASSFENTIVPTAGAIKGTFTAHVDVKNTSTHAPICSASAQMTVN